jgi:hypothetical protein
MDGLALLCTLHADGPATLKRLRNAGCANLTALLERPITEVALALDVAPAAARRLLREARLLAERVGPELEAEEGPAPVAAVVGPEPLALELPPLPITSKLDQGDRALLERIVREGRAARPAAESGTGMALPGLAPVPTALERAGLDLSGEGRWPGFPPEAVLDEHCRVDLPPVLAAPVAAVPDVAPLLALEGVDAPLAHALVRLGIHTLDDLARADALLLGRELRLTFAQAKRLCFLARRAAGTGNPTAAPQAKAKDERSVMAARIAPPEPATSAPPVGGPPALQQSTLRPAWRIEPRTQPLATAAEQHVAAVVVPIAGPVSGPVEVARARFWEPRSGAGVHAPAGPVEPQGVLVDPSEVDRPRRFSDVRRTASEHAAGTTGPRQAGVSPAVPQSDGHAVPPRTGGTTLGWNFEIPRPELPAATEPEPARRTWQPLTADGLGADESSAGPFA